MTRLLRTVNINKWPLIFCLLGFVLNWIAYYPGFLSPDGFDQYSQALSGQYNDWHSPIMAALWSLFIKIHSGVLPMLLFQLSLLWIAIYILMTVVQSRFWQISIGLLSLAPFVQNFAAFIVKDTQMAFAWLLAIAVMLKTGTRNKSLRWWEAIICLLLITYGAWVRINALPGAIPICFLFVYLTLPKQSRYIKIASAILLIAFLGSGLWIFNYKILKAEKTYPQAKLYLHDLSGIYAATGKSFYPEYLFISPNFDTAVLRSGYNTATFDQLWIGKNDSEIFSFETDSQVHALRQAWVKAILTYPGSYLKNRTKGFLYYLRIKERSDVFYYYFPDIYPVPNSLGLVYKRNIVSEIFLRPIEWQKNMPYMKPWFWLVLGLFLLGFIGKFRNYMCSLTYKTLILSSLLYLLPGYFIFPTDTDFRYFYWNCISSSLAVCILLLDRFYYTDRKSFPVPRRK